MHLLLMLLIKFAYAPTGDVNKQIDAVCDDIKESEEKIEVACDIERNARSLGVREKWFIKGLIVNAYAESSLDPDASSPSGSSHGVFQMHVNGMGSGWSIKDMKDVSKSTRAIIKEAKERGIYKKKRNENSATKFLCEKVLRPKNSQEQIEKRAMLLQKLF